MNVYDYIVDNAILTNLEGKTKREVVAELLAAMKEAGRLAQTEKALSDIMAQEKMGSSGIGSGVAIPHACTSAVHQPMITVGISRGGVDFESIDGKPAHIIFLILGRPNGEALQLKIVGRLARLFHIPGFLDSLQTAGAPEQILSLLRSAEKELGDMEPPRDAPNICIAGAGNGGIAMAGHFSLIGCNVRLFNRSEQRLNVIRMAGGIQVAGEVNGFGKISVATTDAGEAVPGADIIMVVIPATGHREMARLLAPHLTDGQAILLNPGSTGGALEFAEVLRQMGVKKYLFIAEAETLVYACRITNPGQVRIFRIKNAVPVATFPAYHITDVLGTLRKILPCFVPGDNVLKTSMSNISAVFHPALMLLNAAWIEEQKGNFEFYVEGASASVANILEVLDAERVRVAEALGVRVLSAREWLYQAYGVVGKNLYEAMQANEGYRGIKAPSNLDHRYITEDVPACLVPTASLGDHLGVPVPTIKTIIHLAGILHGVNYFAIGRTVERLGLAGMSVRQIRRLVEEGRTD
ncbi:MAG TPA: NAD/NADP octopine/nopaline dehydrogenase family protein [Candidatus Sumerlaeia bacterium]|nr:MAG: Opine dehydrogenase [candidate division BRC1 bacterium ADurb.Bin183]HRR99133.1 NAD/NADP octopine/nopaline dehydrogenase family protein [Candidatus Sumerlaeia bacterium]